MKTTFFETDYCVVELLPQLRTVFIDWKDFPGSANFRTGMDQIIEAMAQSGFTKVLSDTTRLGAIAPEDQEWSVVDWNPRALAKGFSAIALILPQDAFAQFSIDEVMQNASEAQAGRTLQGFFDSMAAAEAWLAGAGNVSQLKQN
jgi:hypothetical protein